MENAYELTRPRAQPVRTELGWWDAGVRRTRFQDDGPVLQGILRIIFQSTFRLNKGRSREKERAGRLEAGVCLSAAAAGGAGALAMWCVGPRLNHPDLCIGCSLKRAELAA